MVLKEAVSKAKSIIAIQKQERLCVSLRLFSVISVVKLTTKVTKRVAKNTKTKDYFISVLQN
jgi:hypothetical protein